MPIITNDQIAELVAVLKRGQSTMAGLCARVAADAVVIADQIEEIEAQARLITGMDERLAACEVIEKGLRDEVERYREALTPSADTKAAYIGEIKLDVMVGEDEEGFEQWAKIPIPWTATKETMTMIAKRAARASAP